MPSQTPVPIVPRVVILAVPAAATVTPPIVRASVSKVPSTSTSPAKSMLPGIVTTELAPNPTVTSTSLLTLPPVKVKPESRPPSWFATLKANFPDSSPAVASCISANILAYNCVLGVPSS